MSMYGIGIKSPPKVLELTAPDGPYAIECYDLRSWRSQGFVKEFDPEYGCGRGGVDLTPKMAESLAFKSFDAALTCWKMASATAPFRPDGKPNRPLTHYTVQIIRRAVPHEESHK